MKLEKPFFAVALLLGLGSLCRAADPIPLSIYTREYPHMESIRNGSIQIPECRISYSTMSNTELNQHLDQGSAGDIIEVDFLSYLKRFSSEQKHDWVLVPVYLWREFPQHHVLVYSQAPVGEKLTVDFPNNSLFVWARGILESSPTFKARELWSLSPDISKNSWKPFFLDSKTVEQEYFRETRIFPIITVLAVRKELVEANPWLPEALFIAFAEAKSQALTNGTIPLPWGAEHRDETIELMHKSYWSYGVKNNPKTLSALFKYAHEQGFTNKELTPDDVFSGETLQLIDEKGGKN